MLPQLPSPFYRFLTWFRQDNIKYSMDKKGKKLLLLAYVSSWSVDEPSFILSNLFQTFGEPVLRTEQMPPTTEGVRSTLTRQQYRI